LEKQHRPVWAVRFSVSFDDDAIRDDFVSFLNALHMKAVQDRARRMVWREGTDLHLINVSSLTMIDSGEYIARWQRGIQAAKDGRLRRREEKCLYGSVDSLFDSLRIHSMTADALGRNWEDTVTVISTDRQVRFGKLGLKPL